MLNSENHLTISMNTILTLESILPLTCTRTGTCCHGKLVRLNPWELAVFAKACDLSPSQFRDKYCRHGGVQIRFDGAPGWKGQQACSLYDPTKGCIAHEGRPLACRLYPLGREKQEQASRYMYLGKAFPCLDGCPEVQSLPQMSVSEYLAGQGTQEFETAQDAYLEVMQDLAEWAFVLMLDTGVSLSTIKSTARQWQQLGKMDIAQLSKFASSDWMDLLMVPNIPVVDGQPLDFIQQHTKLLQERAQKSFGSLQGDQNLCNASALALSLALCLSFGVGAKPSSLAERWVQGLLQTAKAK